ncbi:hypothetical protein HPP05_43005 [Corallococcus exiguus]|uniref:hypothetical protein n=1 Tax=Corallococcus exiguus TaxID=83462 RepID=UPI0014947837|nr:hypothetical protein [Corallococcus exiguus]NPC76501.1 hypothetical protein [Corallococcus exiguus]
MVLEKRIRTWREHFVEMFSQLSRFRIAVEASTERDCASQLNLLDGGLCLAASSPMPRAYSTDLTERDVAAYQTSDGSMVEVAEQFSNASWTLSDWLKLGRAA